MSAKNKLKGNAFEYRVLHYMESHEGWSKYKRQALSGATHYSEDKSDLIGTYRTIDFLIECKKTGKLKMQFHVEWMEENKIKAERIHRIPILTFSGSHKPIYVMIDNEIFNLINMDHMIIRDFECRATKIFTIHFDKIIPLLKGQANESDKMKVVRFLNKYMMMELEEFTKFIDLSLKHP